MLFETLDITATQLNEHFATKLNEVGENVIVSSLINSSGELAITEMDKVVLTLLNIEEERVKSHGGRSNLDSPIQLNLYVLFSACYSENNYQEALSKISEVISFFQRNRTLNQQNTPALPGMIEKLSFEILNLDMHQLSNVWGAMGGKLMPFVCYKIRTVAIHDGASMIPDVSFNSFNAR